MLFLLEPQGWNWGLEAGIAASGMEFGPPGWYSSPKAEIGSGIGAMNLMLELGIQPFEAEIRALQLAGIWAWRLEFGPKG